MGCSFVKFSNVRRPWKEAWQRGTFEWLVIGFHVDIGRSLTGILYGLKSGRLLVHQLVILEVDRVTV